MFDRSDLLIRTGFWLKLKGSFGTVPGTPFFEPFLNLWEGRTRAEERCEVGANGVEVVSSACFARTWAPVLHTRKSRTLASKW